MGEVIPKSNIGAVGAEDFEAKDVVGAEEKDGDIFILFTDAISESMDANFAANLSPGVFFEVEH